MNIKILNSFLVSQIAAGETIERPSSVVKELLENSLDAGATEVNLEIENGGIKLIRLRDNGCGIAKEDLPLALQRHATSKIQTLDDLEHVQSLGFRGEALASIAAIARFKLISKVKEASSGWQLATESGSDDLALQPSPHPVGTTIEVRDLFFNIPVRRKFLRTEQTEFNHILEIVGRLALSRFDVEFLLKHNGKLIWSLAIAKTAQEALARVGEIINQEFIQHAYAIDVGANTLKLSGWISHPTYTRSQPDLQYLYINGRIIRDKTLSHAIRQAYQDVIYHQRHPVVVLYLNIDPTLVDVNVHPTKSEVRFRDSRLIHDFVAQGLKESLATGQALVTHAEPAATWLPPQLPAAALVAADQPAVYERETSAISDQYTPRQQASELIKFAQSPSFAASANKHPMAHTFPPIPKLGLALAQLHETYILAQNQDGLIVVDAHAAHERINYEKLKQLYYSAAIPMQTLLVPFAVTLNSTEINWVEAHSESLQKFGFVLTRSSQEGILVRAIPILLQKANIEQLIKDVITDLQAYDNPDTIIRNSGHILATMACHSSIRAGQKLSLEEMNSLLRTLEHTTSGDYCGHGRPTWISFTLKDLAKMFWRS